MTDRGPLSPVTAWAVHAGWRRHVSRRAVLSAGIRIRQGPVCDEKSPAFTPPDGQARRSEGWRDRRRNPSF